MAVQEKGGNVDLRHEQRDIHDIDEILSDSQKLDQVLESFKRKRRKGELRMGTPEVIRDPEGMGKVYDYRAFTRPAGGRIKVQVSVEHIPVVPQMDGRADLDLLWRVLVDQGLMVHQATDGEGNVAIYTDHDVLNYQAKGANSLSNGTEHMHLSVNEPWSLRQLRASAWLSSRLYDAAGVTTLRGLLGPGNGYVTVRKRGHVTHESVSHNAGFDDRSDPGPLYEAKMDEVAELAQYFHANGHF